MSLMQSEPAGVKTISASDSQNGSAVWWNGNLVDAAEVGISPFDHGMLVGDGVFETMTAYGGEPFACRRHYERLTHSATTMGLGVPPRQVLDDAMRAVLKANGLSEARIRLTLTSGEGPLGSARGHAEQSVMVAVSPMPAFELTTKVVVVPYLRNEKGALTGIKTTSYGENVVALKYAKERGAGEALFSNTAGQLCEGTGTNIFLVLDGVLVTPPLASGCLAGVTRSVLLDICKKEGIPAEERDIPIEDLKRASEAFLTSTLREVQGIEYADDYRLPMAPGPITEQLAKAFKARVAADMDP